MPGLYLDGDIDYWATKDLNMSPLKRQQWPEFEWSIKEYHRDLKQCCGVEKAQVRSAGAQRNHIGLAIRAFLRLNLHWFHRASVGMSLNSALFGRQCTPI